MKHKPFLGVGLLFLSLSEISAAGLARGEVECTADLLELVGEEVMGCVRKQQQIGAEVGAVFSGDEMYREEGVCIMIHRIVHKCGNMWRNCYTDPEVKEMQSLQLTELREQYQHRVDYTKCIDNLDTVEEEELSIIEDNLNTSLPVNTSASYDNEDVYEYSVMFDTDASDTMEGGVDIGYESIETVAGGGQHNCDERSCQVEVHDSSNIDKPGFFGSITKLLQPLFTLDL